MDEWSRIDLVWSGADGMLSKLDKMNEFLFTTYGYDGFSSITTRDVDSDNYFNENSLPKFTRFVRRNQEFEFKEFELVIDHTHLSLQESLILWQKEMDKLVKLTNDPWLPYQVCHDYGPGWERWVTISAYSDRHYLMKTILFFNSVTDAVLYKLALS
jgi:hypothetical protein